MKRSGSELALGAQPINGHDSVEERIVQRVVAGQDDERKAVVGHGDVLSVDGGAQSRQAIGDRSEVAPELRILTVRQPYAWAIIHGGKDVENRVRNIAGDYRGPVAIHVGLAFPYTRDCNIVRDLVGSWPPVTDRWDHVINAGTIIGVVDLVGAHVCTSHRGDSDVPDCAHSGTPLAMTCSPWAEFRRGKTVHHLVLANPRPLAEPIPYRGALGLRRLDADMTAQILEAIA